MRRVSLLLLPLAARLVAAASDCSRATPEQCLNHVKTPMPDCHYDWSQQMCVDGPPTPGSCQAQGSKNDCNAAGCFFDPYLGTCFATLAEINSIYQCAYWTSYVDPDGHNQACGWHGCATQSDGYTCADITQEGSNQQQDTTTVYTSNVLFGNERVEPGSALFEFDITTQGTFTSQDYINPKHKILQVLAPVANPAAYSQSPDGICSSVQVSQYTSPAAFSSSIPPAALGTAIDIYYNFHEGLEMNWNDTSAIDYSQDILFNDVSVSILGDGATSSGQIQTVIDNVNIDPAQFADIPAYTSLRLDFASFKQVHKLRFWYLLDSNHQGGIFALDGWPTSGNERFIFKVSDTIDFLTAEQRPGLNYVDVYVRALYDSDHLGFQFYNNAIPVRLVAVQVFGKQSSATQETIIYSPPNPTAQQADDVLARIIGTPKIGPNELIRSWSFDGYTITFHAAIDLPSAVRNCSLRGASKSTTSNGEQFIIPISYVEASVNGLFAQSTKIYTINIITSGQITIGATSQFHEKGYPLSISYPQTDCAENQARQQIVYGYEVHDVFTADQIVGPRSAADISVLSDPQINGPLSCYNEMLTDFQYLGCNYNETFTCKYQYTVQTECRDLTADGNAFNLCSYGPTYATGYNGDAFPASYDAVHRASITNYACPSGTVDKDHCKMLAQNVGGYPSQVVAKIVSSNYLAESRTFNPFRVSCGLLPTPTSALSLVNTLTDADSSGQIKYFDGNLFSNQAMTTVCKLPDELLNTYQLRVLVKPGNTTFNPLDPYGRILGNSDYNAVYNDYMSASGGYQLVAGTPDGQVGGLALTPVAYSGRTVFDIDEVQNGMIFTTKNFYNAGCGPAGTCFKLPATIGRIGADGWSVPVSQLKSLVKANGYQWAIGYQIELVDAYGLPFSSNSPQWYQNPGLPESAPTSATYMLMDQRNSIYEDVQIQPHHAARQLLQTSPSGVSTTRTTSKNYYVGTLHFQVSIDANNTISILPVGQGVPAKNGTQEINLDVFVSNFLGSIGTTAVRNSSMFANIYNLAVIISLISIASIIYWMLKRQRGDEQK